MNKKLMTSQVIMAVMLVVFVFVDTASAQTQQQTVTFVGPIKVGHEADGSQWLTEVWFENPTQTSAQISYRYPFSVHEKTRASDFDNIGFGGINLTTSSNTTNLLSSSGSVQEGNVTYTSTQTWHPSLKVFLGDINVQTIIKHVDASGRLLSASSEAVNAESTALSGRSFLCQAMIRPDSEVGITIRNDNDFKVKVIVSFIPAFTFGETMTTVVKVKPGRTATFFLRDLFPAPNDNNGNTLTDRTLSIETKGGASVFAQAFRLESGINYPIPVFLGLSAMAQSADSVAISALQKSTGVLVLHATSTAQPDALLTAIIVLVGGETTSRQLVWSGEDYFLPKEVFPLVFSVTVSSSLGGSATLVL